MNTYAELYGNIKKRTLKSDLGNKVISEKIGLDNVDPVFEKAIGIVNNEQVGGALENTYKALMPFANENRLTGIAEQASALADFSVGRECPFYK